MDPVKNAVLTLSVVIAVLAVILWLVTIVSRLNDFLGELRYINMELGRCSARMRPKWLQRRCRLWFSLLIPFYKP